MIANVHLDQALRLVGTNEKGHETFFDTSLKGGGLDSAASPMEIVLEAVAACTAMDVIPILRKQRRTVTDFSVGLTAERAAEHPKVFTAISMDIVLTSPDATARELSRAIALSQANYCSVSNMLAKGGCAITWQATLHGPNGSERCVPPEQVSKAVEQDRTSTFQLN